MESYLSDLNPAQMEAVQHGYGPLLVFAGAGSGKTRVLTRRIAHIIRELGASPGEILAVTFTNKAARKMKQRGTLSFPAALCRFGSPLFTPPAFASSDRTRDIWSIVLDSSSTTLQTRCRP